MAFHGQYEHSIDAKDRLTVPKPWREFLSDGVVLAKGVDASVWGFTPAGYQEFSTSFLKTVSPLAPEGLKLRLHFHGFRHNDKLDSANRIRVPKLLAEHAGLGAGPCVLMGAEDWFQLWSPDRWNAYAAGIPAAIEKLAQTHQVGG